MWKRKASTMKELTKQHRVNGIYEDGIQQGGNFYPVEYITKYNSFSEFEESINGPYRDRPVMLEFYEPALKEIENLYQDGDIIYHYDDMGVPTVGRDIAFLSRNGNLADTVLIAMS